MWEGRGGNEEVKYLVCACLISLRGWGCQRNCHGVAPLQMAELFVYKSITFCHMATLITKSPLNSRGLKSQLWDFNPLQTTHLILVLFHCGKHEVECLRVWFLSCSIFQSLFIQLLAECLRLMLQQTHPVGVGSVTDFLGPMQEATIALYTWLQIPFH